MNLYTTVVSLTTANFRVLLQLEFFGKLSWTILLRCTLPLAIFHRFHSSVVLAAIWKNSYKTRLEWDWKEGPPHASTTVISIHSRFSNSNGAVGQGGGGGGGFLNGGVPSSSNPTGSTLHSHNQPPPPTTDTDAVLVSTPSSIPPSSFDQRSEHKVSLFSII